MSAWARPGVKCVCVNSFGSIGPGGETVPVVGKTYTIRDVLDDHPTYRIPGIRLDEIVNAPRQYDEGYEEVWFAIEGYFRPLVPPKSLEEDIALFTPLLNTTKERQPA